MKKIITTTLVIMMTVALAVSLTGCGTNPVAEEFEKFLNTHMVEVNAKYEQLKTEMDAWSKFENDKQLAENIKTKILPNINESLDMLSKIQLNTEEVNAIKDKYKKVLDTYKAGFEQMLVAAESSEEAALKAAGEKINEAIKLLDDYNKSLEALAKEHDMEVKF